MHDALVRGFVGRFLVVVSLFLALYYAPASKAGTEPAGSTATARYAHISIALLDGRALIAGGFPASGTSALASAEIFDPIAGAFSSTAAMATPRANAGAALLPDGRVLVVGGVSTTTGSALPSAEIYDPAAGTWTSAGWNGSALQSPTVLTMPDGRVMFVAGDFFAMSCTLYDPATGNSFSCFSLNASRVKPAAAVLADGRVLVAGGQPSSGQIAVTTAEIFDPITGTWSFTGSMALRRTNGTATTLADGRVLVAGGAQDAAGNSPAAAAELYDPATGTFTTSGSLAVPRSGHAAVTIDGYVYVVGGYGLNPTASIERYDAVSGAWSSVTSLSVPRRQHAAATLVDRDVLITGGITTSAASSATSGAELARPGCIATPAQISPASASYASDGGSDAISLTPAAGCAWRVTNVPTWVTLTSASQGSGSATVTYSVAPQTASTARSATLNVADSTFTINQSGNPCATATVSPSSLSIAIGGGSGTISVSGNSTCSWTVTGVPSWLTVTPMSGTGGAFISYSVASNPDAPRSATLMIAGRTVNVSQAGNPCLPAPTISPASRTYTTIGGTSTVAVTAPSACTWSVTGKPTWITMATAGTGSATLNVTATVNNGFDRTATFTIAGNSFTATQAASPCADAVLDQSGVSADNGSGSGTVTVMASASCTWDVTGTTAWLTATPTSGSGSATIGYTYAANASTGAARSATLIIAGRTFVVSQAAGACSPAPTLSSTSGSFSATGTFSSSFSNDGSVNVTAPSTCAWTVGTLPAWITTTSPLPASGSGTLTSVVGNNAGAARSASFTIAGVSYTANQLAPGAATLPTGRLTGPRQSHAAQALLDGRVLVTGGELPGFVISASADLYDPATGMFSATGAMNEPRSRHGMVRLADGRVLALGGLTTDPVRLATAEIYDPATGTWTPTGAMSVAREWPIAVALPDGRVLVTLGSTDGIGLLDSTEIFDPATESFTPSGPVVVARSRPAAAVLADGRVLLAGGATLSGPDLASVELWDPTTGAWSVTGSMASPRKDFTATTLAGGNVLVAGGWTGSGTAMQYVEAAELYDPVTGTFTATGALVIPRNGHSAVALADGSVALIGGLERDGWFSGSIERYNPATGVWQLAGQMSDRRISLAAAPLPGGKVLAAGGAGNNGGALATVELFDPAVCAATPTLSPTSASFTGSGGSSSVSVTMPAGCPRLVAGKPSWITISTGTTGAGSGTVFYSVAANTGVARSATFKIASQSFTVTQAAGGAAACGFVGSVSSPGTYTGTLASGDCTQGARGTSYYTDRWSFVASPGQQVAFRLSSTAFDTYLYLRNPAGTVIASNDDGGGGTNSRIPATAGVFTLPAGSTGTYVIEVTSFSTFSTGAYTLQRIQ